MGAFSLLARVLEAPALDSTEESSENSTPRSRADNRMAGIGMSPSNPWMGEMKLYRSEFKKLEYEILKKQ
jgi:hypothetical protein